MLVEGGARARVSEITDNGSFVAASVDEIDVSTQRDGLLKTATGERFSTWQMLKREPKRPTNKETRSYLQHIRRLQALVEQLPKPDIPVPK